MKPPDFFLEMSPRYELNLIVTLTNAELRKKIWKKLKYVLFHQWKLKIIFGDSFFFRITCCLKYETAWLLLWDVPNIWVKPNCYINKCGSAQKYISGNNKTGDHKMLWCSNFNQALQIYIMAWYVVVKVSVQVLWPPCHGKYVLYKSKV